MPVAYQFICPNCGHKDPDNFIQLGEKVKCSKCKSKYFLVLKWEKTDDNS